MELNLDTRWGWMVSFMLSLTPPGGKSLSLQYPLPGRLDGPQIWSRHWGSEKSDASAGLMSSTPLGHYTGRYPGSRLGGIGIQTAGRQQKVDRALKRMTEGMCSRWGRRGGGSWTGSEVPKERPVKMCWKGTGKNQAKMARNTFLDWRLGRWVILKCFLGWFWCT